MAMFCLSQSSPCGMRFTVLISVDLLTSLKYIGQAAYISDIPSAYSNPFFNTVPPGMFYPSLVVAILAAIVASQAMITSAFQVFLKFWA
jgi:K+ transporter